MEIGHKNIISETCISFSLEQRNEILIFKFLLPFFAEIEKTKFETNEKPRYQAIL